MLYWFSKKYCFGQIGHLARLILESKGKMGFFRKGAKKGKIFENLSKNVQNLITF